MSGFFNRIFTEEANKIERVYLYSQALGVDGALVTRVFPIGAAFVEKHAKRYEGPTLRIPFGKYLGWNPVAGVSDFVHATLCAALVSILAQLLYDIFWTIVYGVTLPFSLVGGIGFIMHAIYTDNEQSRDTAETLFGNVICAFYFLGSILVDFCREILGIVARTYATIMESEKDREQNYWYADNQQYLTAKL